MHNFEKEKQLQSPWIISLDNIFLDVARELPDNSYLNDNNIVPGTQNTALTD
jgi:sugar/nucleoside kinase (ribokinase family)